MPETPEQVRAHLTRLARSGPPIPTVDALRAVFDAVRGGAEPDQIADMFGWTPDLVVDTVEAFGAFWLRAGKLGRITVTAGQVTARLDDGTYTVAMPEGWADTGRPVASALAIIGATDLPDAALDRFRVRHYKPGPALVSASTLWALAWLGQTGVWADVLLDLDAEDHRFAERLLVAWDYWLRTARRASEARAVLLDDSADPADVIDAAAAARWLAPVSADRIIGPATVLVDDPQDRSAQKILAARRRAATGWRVPSIPGELTCAHAHMVATAAGLQVDAADARKARSTVRAFLYDIGAGSDLDVDVPDGVDALTHGLWDQWCDARRARAAGDTGWHQQWAAAAAAAR